MDISEIEKNLLKIKMTLNSIETQLNYLKEYIQTDNLIPTPQTKELFSTLGLISPSKEEFLSTFNTYLVSENLVGPTLVIKLNPLLEKSFNLSGSILYADLIKMIID